MSAIDEVLPDIAASGADLPRSQSGTAPQHLTVMLLADYGLRQVVWWPSAGVVSLLAEFGVSDAAARAALSRLARRGVLYMAKTGRNTSYRLSEPAVHALIIGGKRIASFAADAESWDGQWTVVGFSLSGREDPRQVRKRLRWLGYAPIYDGLWVSPHADPVATTAGLKDLEPSALTIFRGPEIPVAQPAHRSPNSAWDLPWIASQYQEFLDRWTPVRAAMDAETLDGSAALVSRTQVMESYRRFPALDLLLPEAVMPGGWPRQPARRLFEQIYDQLGNQAELRVREILDDVTGEIPAGLGHHTVADLSATDHCRARLLS